MTIAGLFILILPVFLLIGVGVGLRRCHVVEGTAETSIIRLVVHLCMPCLAFDTIVGNASLRLPGNLILPPLAGFTITCAGMGVAYVAARMIGLGKGTGLRTFALAAGVSNYSYLPFPIIGGLWGQQTQGLLLVHNMGVDLAIWSVGILVLTGSSLSSGWKRLVSPMFITILAAIAINVLGLSPVVPGFARSMVHSLAVCAVPLGLLMTGVNLANYLDEPAKLLHRNVAIGACAVRLAVLPVLILGFAYILPCSVELKRVLAIQAAMPAAVLPIIIAQYYGGQPLTAVQVVLPTTAASLVTCPLWIRAGLAWLGLS
ncbi:MAG TPA: AEC family transporter [Opitutaceae bacterium]|nr:AEC family transporter [Opitutaceae bacterium]